MSVTLSSNSNILSDLMHKGYKIEQSNGHSYVKIGEIRVEIEEGDTAWTIVQKLENAEREAKRKNEIAEGQRKVKEYANKFEEALENVAQLRRSFWSFLKDNNVSTLDELTGKKYEEGKSIVDAKRDAQTARNRYLHLTITTANDTVGLCLNA